MIDKSISFGQQNFLFVKADETDLIYDFVGYMTKKGTILIARFPKDGTSALYYLGAGNFDTIWTARATKTYGYPNTLIDQNV